MFGTSGIRGPIGETITPELGLQLGRALAHDTELVVIGRDTRTTSQYLGDAVSLGLRASGTDVYRLGVATTPTVARSVAWEDADAGVMITASHNPPPDNGFKLWQPSGQAYDGSLRESITNRITNSNYPPITWDSAGEEHELSTATSTHIQKLIDSAPTVDVDIVIDIGNGAGSMTPRIFSELECPVQTLNANPDGRFPGRLPEPTEEHCTSICQLVKSTDAEVGIVHDGDADRMMAVTETGDWISGDTLLALFAKETVTSGDKIAVPLNTSLAVDDTIAQLGATCIRTKVGDVFIAEETARTGVVFGGEPSGSWIWPDHSLCPDGPLAAVRLAAIVTQNGPLSELVRDIPNYPLRRESFEVPNKHELMDHIEHAITEHYPEEDIQRLDGLRVTTNDGWFLIRASGTQPLIRITAEGRTASQTDTLFETARSFLNDHLTDPA